MKTKDIKEALTTVSEVSKTIDYKTLKPIVPVGGYIGCAAEFQLIKDGKIVNATEFVAQYSDRINLNQQSSPGTCLFSAEGNKLIVKEGIGKDQAYPFTCRANFGNSLARGFNRIMAVGYTDFRYGNLPGTIYLSPGSIPASTPTYYHQSYLNKDIIIPILHILVANTCVLVSKDSKRNPIIAKNLRNHIMEKVDNYDRLKYDCLSNFWMRDYKLMHMIFSFARFATGILYAGKDYTEAILNAVDIDNVWKALEENNAKLALENFNKIEPILLHFADYSAGSHGSYNYKGLEKEYFALCKETLPKFKFFNEKGLSHFFNPKDKVISKWATMPDGHNRGWESFMSNMQIS